MFWTVTLPPVGAAYVSSVSPCHDYSDDIVSIVSCLELLESTDALTVFLTDQCPVPDDQP